MFFSFVVYSNYDEISLIPANLDDGYINKQAKEYNNFEDPDTQEVDFAAKELEETEDTPQTSNKEDNKHGQKNETMGTAHNPQPPQAHKAENRETRTGIMQNDFVFICKFHFCRFTGKLDVCICENKDADKLCSYQSAPLFLLHFC